MTASEIAKRNLAVAQKIVGESSYVAPEVRNDWLKAKIADYLARAYSAGIEESKGDSLPKPVVCPEAEASQLRKGQKPSEEFLMRAHEHTHRHLDESFTLIESQLNAFSKYIAASECVTFDGAYAQALTARAAWILISSIRGSKEMFVSLAAASYDIASHKFSVNHPDAPEGPEIISLDDSELLSKVQRH